MERGKGDDMNGFIPGAEKDGFVRREGARKEIAVQWVE